MSNCEERPFIIYRCSGVMRFNACVLEYSFLISGEPRNSNLKLYSNSECLGELTLRSACRQPNRDLSIIRRR